jgi:hypothetical protein
VERSTRNIEHTQRPDEPKRREIEIGTKEYNRKDKERQERHIHSIWKTSEWNWSLSMLALLRFSLCINPALFLRGATPLNSWPLLLIYKPLPDYEKH